MEIANAQFDDKEKRLRKNTNQRNQYAQLTKKKKELLLQNRRQQHAQNRKRLPTDQHIIIRANASVDQRVFNRPTSSQVAAIWCENTESEERESRDIIVYNHSGFKYMVEHYYGSHEPLPYPLLFPYGEIGWHQGIQRVDVGETQLCEGQYVMAPQNSKSASELIKKEQKAADVEIDIVDEIQQFQSVRWISASEAMWRIYRFTMSAKLALTRGRYLVLQIACFYHGATEITLKMWKFPMRY